MTLQNNSLFSGEAYLRTVLDAFPTPTFIVDHNLQIQDANIAAIEILNEGSSVIFRRLCGDLMHCFHARHSESGCGNTEHCPNCALRQTVKAIAGGEKNLRRTAKMLLEKQKKVQEAWFLVNGSAFEYEKQKLVILTVDNISEIIELRKIIPICSFCRKTRDDDDFWQEVENYLDKHTNIQFSHGVCPDCAKKHYPDTHVGKKH